MNRRSPIYTETTGCQDCYKCIRECHIKAITMDKGHAAVAPELCILCGHCVQVCPVKAKKIRNDLPVVRELLKNPIKPVLSLAPSWWADFPQTSPGQIAAAIRKAGFAGVSETALGAQEVIRGLSIYLAQKPGLHISTACPTAVDFLVKYRPELASKLVPFCSPLQAHARALKARMARGTAVVFAGPCIAKKGESDAFPEDIDAALTFRELRTLLKECDGDPEVHGAENDSSGFFPFDAGPGTFFPLDGGMKSAFELQSPHLKIRHLSFSGLRAVEQALDGLADYAPEEPVFLELLACEGGCINGPGCGSEQGSTQQKRGLVARRLLVEKAGGDSARTFGNLDMTRDKHGHPGLPVHVDTDPRTVAQVLHSMGKNDPREELNCSGCGYDSCRALAQAVTLGRAEPEMCVSRNRKLAQKKLNALVSAMPSALVIINQDLKILESNKAFAVIAGPDALDMGEVRPGLEGLSLPDFVPFHQEFRDVLQQGTDLVEKQFTWGDKILQGSIFTIEKGQTVGGIFQDVTAPTVQKNQVVGQTRRVIRKNLEIVQKIAFLLGENAAETEAILSSILETFGNDE